MIDSKIWQELLKAFPLFQNLQPELLNKFKSQALSLKGESGKFLFQESDRVEIFPLVLSGSIKVYKSDVSGKSVTLYDVTRGEACVLTTSGLLSGRHYPASGKVASELVAVGLPKGLFFELIDKNPDFQKYVFGIFSERLAQLLEMIEEVSFKKLDERLARYLFDRRPEIKATHQSISEDLGSSREIISRLLKRFEQDQLIQIEREKTRIIDESGLKEIFIRTL